MIIFKDHFNLLLKKYNLTTLYYKYIIFNYLLTLCEQGIYWCILLFTRLLVNNGKHIINYIICIVSLLFLQIILSKYANNLRDLLHVKLKNANNKYFTDRLFKLSKKTLLDMNLGIYNKLVENINDIIIIYTTGIKLKNDLPLVYLRLIIISYKLEDLLVIIFGVLYFINTYYLYSLLYNKTYEYSDKLLDVNHNVVKYIVNSKNLLINDNYNYDYFNKVLNKLEKIENKMEITTQNIYLYTNIGNFIFIIIILYFNLNKINKDTFYYYFMIIYDVLHIESMNHSYFMNKNRYNRIDNSIQLLYKYNPEDKKYFKTNKIKQITINKLDLIKPKLILNEQLIIQENDHILLDGSSGCGKTSLLYILKGIINVDNIDIKPKIEEINSQSFITLPNYKGIYSGYLYDIITNYNSDPDIALINNIISVSKFNIFNNIYIDIHTISAGEQMRLYIARIIYLIKSNDNYNILLFDEIDQNLDDNLANEICNKIRTVFNDKIILYITHNELIKKLFTKKITISNGIIITKNMEKIL